MCRSDKPRSVNCALNVSVAAVGNFSDEIGYLPSSTTILPVGPHVHLEDVDVAIGPGEGSFMLGFSQFKRTFL